MKVKITVQFADGDGNFAHTTVNDPKKPVIVDVRESVGQQWVKNGWAIRLEESKPEPKPEAKPERAVIETPEDHSEVSERETATQKRKKK